MAPEVLNGKYDERCDVWSLGVILYIMFTGSPPFKGGNSEQIMASVKKGKFNIDVPEMANVSEPGKDLLRKMLTYNYENRVTAADCLNHEWFNDETLNAKGHLDPNVLSNFRSFYVCLVHSYPSLSPEICSRRLSTSSLSITSQARKRGKG